MGTYRWVGRSIIAVGVIHCLVGALIFATPLMEIVNDGVWNAVDGFRGLPPVVCYGFSGLALFAIIAMPVGGGWLLVPSAVGLLIKRQKGK